MAPGIPGFPGRVGCPGGNHGTSLFHPVFPGVVVSSHGCCSGGFSSGFFFAHFCPNPSPRDPTQLSAFPTSVHF